MKIAALVPTLYRRAGLERVVESLHKTAPNVRVVVAHEKDDDVTWLADLEGVDWYNITTAICAEYRQGCAYAWNTALKAVPNYDHYVLASDDVEFLPGWLEVAELDKHPFAGLNACFGPPQYSCFYSMSREFIVKHHGGVAAVPHYKVWGVDTEACERAYRVGLYWATREQVVVHHHAGLPPEWVRMATKRIYNTRRAAGFPDDFERILCE